MQQDPDYLPPPDVLFRWSCVFVQGVPLQQVRDYYERDEVAVVLPAKVYEITELRHPWSKEGVLVTFCDSEEYAVAAACRQRRPPCAAYGAHTHMRGGRWASHGA